MLEILTQDFNDDYSQENSSNRSTNVIIGSPRDVYNYDVINRNQNYETANNDELNEDETDKTSTSNNSEVIDGNINLFDLIGNENFFNQSKK